MKTIKATISRRNIGNNKIGNAFENVIKAGHKVILVSLNDYAKQINEITNKAK